MKRKEQFQADENAERGNWSGKLDFILSVTGYAVGLGNIWRFPYIAYVNGGGSFLFPYAIMLIFAGLPLFFMEMGLGQFASVGPITIWRAVPFFRGIGVAMVIISGLVSVYYNMIIAYTIYYLFASMNKEVPWQNCKPEWKELGCVDRVLSKEQAMARNMTKKWCETIVSVFNNQTGSDMHSNTTNGTLMTSSAYMADCSIKEKNPSLIFWEHEVLGMSNSLNEGSSEFHWWLILCFIGAWAIVFFALIKGIKSSGKVVYVTATFPYIVLIILLIRNATLEGAREGVEFYIVPKWEELKSYKPWYAAAVQIFYSLGVAFGGLETMASYNKFHNNVQRDSIIVAFVNCGTSVFAGFVIFTVIGHLAAMTGQNIDEVIREAGPGLAFVVYPEGIALMPVAPVWAILFFLMLVAVGLDTQFTIMESIITAIVDEFPWLRQGRRKIVFTLFLCLALFLIGLPQCAANGVFLLELIDTYSAGFSLIVVSICEIVAISYVYSVTRFRKDLQMMLGEGGLFKYMFWPYWLPNWVLITPALLLFVFIRSCINHSGVSYAGYPDAYPVWADRIGWLMTAASLVWIPVFAMIEYGKTHDWMRSWRQVTSPKEAWGPAIPQYRTGIYGTYIVPPPEYSKYNEADTMSPESALSVNDTEDIV